MKNIVYEIKVNKIVPGDGSSIWGETSGVKPLVKEILFQQEEPYYLGNNLKKFLKILENANFKIWVKHNGPWEIYTDRGFEKGIAEIVSKHIGMPVGIGFTEQGMQQKGVASMEFRRGSSGGKFDPFLKKGKKIPK